MDWDEPRSKPHKTITIGEDLSVQSIGELEERIAALQAEIERARTAISSKKAHTSAADALFKGSE